MSRLTGPPEPKKIIQGGHESPRPSLPGCCAALEEALAFLAPRHRAGLMAGWVRGVNQLRALLGSIFPAPRGRL